MSFSVQTVKCHLEIKFIIIIIIIIIIRVTFKGQFSIKVCLVFHLPVVALGNYIC